MLQNFHVKNKAQDAYYSHHENISLISSRTQIQHLIFFAYTPADYAVLLSVTDKYPTENAIFRQGLSWAGDDGIGNNSFSLPRKWSIELYGFYNAPFLDIPALVTSNGAVDIGIQKKVYFSVPSLFTNASKYIQNKKPPGAGRYTIVGSNSMLN